MHKARRQIASNEFEFVFAECRGWAVACLACVAIDFAWMIRIKWKPIVLRAFCSTGDNWLHSTKHYKVTSWLNEIRPHQFCCTLVSSMLGFRSSVSSSSHIHTRTHTQIPIALTRQFPSAFHSNTLHFGPLSVSLPRNSLLVKIMNQKRNQMLNRRRRGRRRTERHTKQLTADEHRR